VKQDISWFDNNNSGTLAIKLFDDLERVKEGTGDKFGMIFQLMSQFFTGTVIW
jgi:ATP-binding cassette subfamily B (MDR/TAP) protein 1